VVASGALNVSYSDGSDPYPTRLKRMLASSMICALAVFVGAVSDDESDATIGLGRAGGNEDTNQGNNYGEIAHLKSPG